MPMSNAAKLLKAYWESADGTLLRFYRGEFYRWTGTHYEPVRGDEMRSSVRGYLASVAYVHG